MPRPLHAKRTRLRNEGRTRSRARIDPHSIRTRDSCRSERTVEVPSSTKCAGVYRNSLRCSRNRGDDVLAFMEFPKAHRSQIASTNPIERVNAEIKRRIDVVGIFPNEAALVRLVGAILLEQNDEWQLQRRYMQLEGLCSLSDKKTNRLSAVVTR